MLRLDIEYDVLPRESEILHLKFWASAFELLKERKAIYFETEGKNKGCWVMPASAFLDRRRSGRQQGDRALERHRHLRRQGHRLSALEIRPAGQGFLLSPAAHATRRPRSSGSPPIEPQATPTSRTSARGITRLQRDRCRASPICRTWWWRGCKALGLRAAGRSSRSIFPTRWWRSRRAAAPSWASSFPKKTSKRPYVEVSGRKGLGVKADDLIDKLIDKALEEVASRHAGTMPPKQQRDVATQIAIGALRYFLLKFTRNSVIAFDFREALSFEGETGPYVQYAAVRARNILRKLEERGGASRFRNGIERGSSGAATRVGRFLAAAAGRVESRCRGRARGRLRRAGARGQYAFQLAQSFNNFYHEYPVLYRSGSGERKPSCSG